MYSCMEGLFDLLDRACITRAAAAKCLQISERKLYRANAGEPALTVHEEVSIRKFRDQVAKWLDDGKLPGSGEPRLARTRNSLRIAALDIRKLIE